MENGSSTKQLKRVLSFKDLFSTAVGQIIGSGIMTLLGVGIALTGRSIPIAFLISAVLVVGNAIPMIVVCGAVRARGGQYTMVAMLAGKRMSGIYTILYTMGNVSLAMYSLSFASYFISLFGFGDEKIIALLLTTFFFVLNVLGIDKMAAFQNVIVLLMCIALGIFAACGVTHIQPDYFSAGFMTGGVKGLFQAGGLLTFAVGGASYVTNLSGEAKHPTRDIPVVIITSTLLVAVLYAVISVVAAGVLPVEQVAGQNLAMVAEVVLSKPLYVFFMVCGAMFALISTLNAQFGWATKPIMQACDDGWFPQKLAYLHPKYKTPVILLGILYGIAVICIVSGLSISILGNLCSISGNLCIVMICVTMWRLPKVAPKGWERSKFKVGKGVMGVLVVVSSGCALFSTYLNATQLSVPILLGNVAVVIGAVIFVQLRMKKARVEPSFEETEEE